MIRYLLLFYLVVTASSTTNLRKRRVDDYNYAAADAYADAEATTVDSIEKNEMFIVNAREDSIMSRSQNIPASDVSSESIDDSMDEESDEDEEYDEFDEESEEDEESDEDEEYDEESEEDEFDEEFNMDEEFDTNEERDRNDEYDTNGEIPNPYEYDEYNTNEAYDEDAEVMSRGQHRPLYDSAGYLIGNNPLVSGADYDDLDKEIAEEDAEVMSREHEKFEMNAEYDEEYDEFDEQSEEDQEYDDYFDDFDKEIDKEKHEEDAEVMSREHEKFEMNAEYDEEYDEFDEQSEEDQEYDDYFDDFDKEIAKKNHEEDAEVMSREHEKFEMNDEYDEESYEDEEYDEFDEESEEDEESDEDYDDFDKEIAKEKFDTNGYLIDYGTKARSSNGASNEDESQFVLLDEERYKEDMMSRNEKLDINNEYNMGEKFDTDYDDLDKEIAKEDHEEDAEIMSRGKHPGCWRGSCGHKKNYGASCFSKNDCKSDRCVRFTCGSPLY